ncbi:hypothetical protein BDN72DRAFT_902911 [Pluteus cervinus]|uniref:Uncharacterized protein n=1 Tax=Pluteus cervinus TaxID=181527 RepID=A0ACD3AAD8_9AGAR|nr:hypothetical protein BDN72DRAFT_902911 [Pluteus cervinus]
MSGGIITRSATSKSKTTDGNDNANGAKKTNKNKPTKGDITTTTPTTRLGVQTRADNKNKRPGQILRSKKRTTEEVQEEKAAKAAALKARQTKLKAAHIATATIERQTLECTQSQLLSPPKFNSNSLTISRHARTRDQPSEGPAHGLDTEDESELSEVSGDDEYYPGAGYAVIQRDPDEEAARIKEPHSDEGLNNDDEQSGEEPDGTQPGEEPDGTQPGEEPNSDGYEEDADEEEEMPVYNQKGKGRVVLAEESEEEEEDLEPDEREMENDEDDSALNERLDAACTIKKSPALRSAVRDTRTDKFSQKRKVEGESDCAMRKKPKSGKRKEKEDKDTGLKQNWNNDTRFLQPLQTVDYVPVQSQPTTSSSKHDTNPRFTQSQPSPSIYRTTQAPPKMGSNSRTTLKSAQSQPSTSVHPVASPIIASSSTAAKAKHAQSQPSMSVHSIASPSTASSSKAAKAKHRPVLTPEDPDIVAPGGLVSDNEGAEPEPIFGSMSLVRIQNETRSLSRPRHRRGEPKRPRPTLSELPRGIQIKFDEVEVVIFDIVGRLEPWRSFAVHDLVQAWTARVGDAYPISPSAPQDSEAFANFKKVRFLMIRNISSLWTHAFAEAATKAVEAEMKVRRLESIEERQHFVKTMLGPLDLRSADRPFIWRSRDSTDEKDWEFSVDGNRRRIEKRKGIFCGCLVARTFSTHLKLVSTEIPNFEPHSQPRGALLMAISAVHRALYYSITTGTFTPPHAAKQKEFSEANWGDGFTEVDTPDGPRRQLVRRATIYLETVDKLQPAQWEAITAAASLYAFKGGARAVPEAPVLESDEEAKNERRQILHDYDYDG